MKLHTALLAALLAAAPGSAPAEDARTSTFRVEGMTCSLCGKAIDKALRDVDGVTAVEVDREAGRATVRAAPHVSAKQLERAIESAGRYSATPSRQTDAGP